MAAFDTGRHGLASWMTAADACFMAAERERQVYDEVCYTACKS